MTLKFTGPACSSQKQLFLSKFINVAKPDKL